MTLIEMLLGIINSIRANTGGAPLVKLDSSTNLREDIGLDSMDLAELTVKLEVETEVDIFADGVVHTVGDILDQLDK